jgi:hypothetical protein
MQAATQHQKKHNAAPQNQAMGPSPSEAPAEQRVFIPSDFAHTPWKDARLTKTQWEEYKKSLLGKPVPPQTVCDDALLALGYEMPEPWVQRCIEEPMPYMS